MSVQTRLGARPCSGTLPRAGVAGGCRPASVFVQRQAAAAAPPLLWRPLRPGSRPRRAPAAPRAEAAAAAAPPPEPGAGAAAAAAAAVPHRHRLRHTSLAWLAGALAAAAALVAVHLATSQTNVVLSLISSARQHLAASALARSGFFAAFSLILLSEVGDKTFFIAALLAMRLGKWVSWWGSLLALAAMTGVSVGIGAVVKRVPAALESSEALGQWAAAALLAWFGLATLRDAWGQRGDAAAGEELEEAAASVSEAEEGGKIGRGRQAPLKALVEVASLIFVAEWGDRSMLATIALGAAQSPLGVAGGAILAHCVATLLAVLGGAALSEHISEKMVGYIGGALFLAFAAATALGLF